MSQEYRTTQDLITESEQELINGILKMLNNRTVQSTIKILSQVENSIYQNSLVVVK